MSRTDVHRPAWVQQTDPHERHRWRRHQTWATEPPELVPLYQTDNCRTCYICDPHRRRETRRRERHQARRDLRNGKAI